MHDEDLRDDELHALRALHHDEDPGRLLEERTVRALRNQGLLAAPRRVISRPLAWAAAAALAFFVAGFAMGRNTSPAGDAPRDAAYRPVDTNSAADMAQRENDTIRIAAADTTAARADRFVVWF